MDTGVERTREHPIKQIDVHTDTRDILAHARQQADKRNFDDVFIVDIDSHHTESESWRDIIAYVDDEVVRAQALDFLQNRTGTPPYGLNGDLALRYQDVGGRVPHQAARSLAERLRREERLEDSRHDLGRHPLAAVANGDLDVALFRTESVLNRLVRCNRRLSRASQ